MLAAPKEERIGFSIGGEFNVSRQGWMCLSIEGAMFAWTEDCDVVSDAIRKKVKTFQQNKVDLYSMKLSTYSCPYSLILLIIAPPSTGHNRVMFRVTIRITTVMDMTGRTSSSLQRLVHTILDRDDKDPVSCISPKSDSQQSRVFPESCTLLFMPNVVVETQESVVMLPEIASSAARLATSSKMARRTLRQVHIVVLTRKPDYPLVCLCKVENQTTNISEELSKEYLLSRRRYDIEFASELSLLQKSSSYRITQLSVGVKDKVTEID
ncbi:hypothetical protein Tco_1353689 [Tanacetum coccineum]